MNLVALGLLLHQSVYLSSRGFKHFIDDLGPAFGLHMGARLRCFVNVGLCLLSFMTIFSDKSRSYTLLLVFALTITIAAFPRRLPNHLPVALFLIVCFAAEALRLGSDRIFDGMSTARRLVACVFFFAAFHKLNRAFFRPESSCGSGLLLHYALQLRISLRRQVMPITILGIYGTVVGEFAVSLLLSCQSTVRVGVVLAVMMVIAFGFLGHAHFAVVMLGGLSAFLDSPFSFARVPEHWGLLLLSILMGALLGNYRFYRRRELAFLNQILLSLIGIEMVRRTLTDVNLTAAGWRPAEALEIPGNVVLLGIFIVNAVSPYLGIKWGGSLAMFSNLRPDVWDHFIVVKPLRIAIPRYLKNLAPASELSSISRPLFFALFPYPENEHYLIGYVAEAVVYISARTGENLSLRGIDTTNQSAITVDSRSHKKLPWFERLSIFPCTLPKSPEPLCD